MPAHFIVLSANLDFVTRIGHICFVDRWKRTPALTLDFSNLRAERLCCRLQAPDLLGGLGPED